MNQEKESVFIQLKYCGINTIKFFRKEVVNVSTYAIIDLETTGNSSGRGDKIIEIGIVVMESDKVTEEFSTFIYPEAEIPPFISNLTGITDDHVMDAPLFSEIVPDLKRLLRQDYVIAHNIDFDLTFINDALAQLGEDQISAKVIDTVELSRVLMPKASGHKLSELSESLELSHDQPHRAISDARVTAELWKVLQAKMKSLPEKTLLYLLKLSAAFKSDVTLILEDLLTARRYEGSGPADDKYELWEGVPVLKLSSQEKDYRGKRLAPAWEEWLQFLFEEPEGLDSIIKSYRSRKEQKKMAESIHQSLHEKESAFIEAGAGIGKSMAYVTAAVHTAVEKKEPVLISTHTNTLQSQLAQKELPLLSKISPVPFTFATLKGSEHYLSLAHFRYELEYGTLHNYDDVLTKAMLLVWVLETETGDIEEIQMPSNGYKFWRKVSADQKGKEIALSMGNYSYYHKAYEKAAYADIIVTTHALFCYDLLKEEEFIPSCRYAIIDEAHHLNSVAAKYFGSRLYYPSVQQLFSQWKEIFEPSYYQNVTMNKEKKQELLKYCTVHIDNAKSEWAELSSYFSSYAVKNRPAVSSDTGKVIFDFYNLGSGKFLRIISDMCERLLKELNQLIRGTETLMNELLMQLQTHENPDLVILITRLDYQIGYYKELTEEIDSIFLKNTENPVWAEFELKHPQGTLTLESESHMHTHVLSERLHTKKDSIIFTSATLAARGSFQFVKKQLGMESVEKEEIIPSPYDYEHQMKVVVPTDIPSIKKKGNGFLYAISEMIFSLALKTNGRMLVLFTSYSMLKNVYYLLREFQESSRYQLIAQGITSGSRDRLKKDFQALDSSILLGTNTFWEGVDIPGEDLSCLVMVRLPFDPPAHPGQQKEEMLWSREGENPFMDLTLPKAVIRFKQGVGRLIRSENDRGLLVILDKRILEANYGRYFIEALPVTRVHEVESRELLEKFDDYLPAPGTEPAEGEGHHE
ncbi:bifunctional ATP-dependent DNA helicase/DNA polymerase III subunit epsilon [Salimicrobium jeotgali]|uniref:3'-5' exonuclease DinG n=1 Tax=Salimicrobium jeotgali TaxID=1230341 RepID=K2GEI1_9BACI|nr:ATP-dependent DNA helicase DinG [Salimicrobium jeotgali]EKE32622.1 bifunctional ATP-dependent DNA helicase/DNA polymerase III subunit epsilon [Salimicrobium jeotgali]